MYLRYCLNVELSSGIQIETCPGVYSPAEDTHLLLSAVKVRKGQRVLEMGCGTGIIALHCARTGCMVVGTDISPDAVENARMNAAINSLNLEVIQSDLFDNVNGKFDIIIFNPPYLSDADSKALSSEEIGPRVGGESGHEISVRFMEQAQEHLAKGGRIYLLVSSESDAGVLESARALYSVRKVAEEQLFFEMLAVLELKILK